MIINGNKYVIRLKLVDTGLGWDISYDDFETLDQMNEFIKKHWMDSNRIHQEMVAAFTFVKAEDAASEEAEGNHWFVIDPYVPLFGEKINLDEVDLDAYAPKEEKLWRVFCELEEIPDHLEKAIQRYEEEKASKDEVESLKKSLRQIRKAYSTIHKIENKRK